MVTGGIVLALAGTAAYTQLAADTAYWYLAAALLLIGAGMGATITPSMAAAFGAVERAAIPAATAAIGTIQRIAGSLGTALLAVTLTRAMTARLPGFHGSIAGAGALAAGDPGHVLPALASAFSITFRVALVLTAAALVPALALPGPPPRRPTAPTRLTDPAHAGARPQPPLAPAAPARLP